MLHLHDILHICIGARSCIKIVARVVSGCIVKHIVIRMVLDTRENLPLVERSTPAPTSSCDVAPLKQHLSEGGMTDDGPSVLCMSLIAISLYSLSLRRHRFTLGILSLSNRVLGFLDQADKVLGQSCLVDIRSKFEDLVP